MSVSWSVGFRSIYTNGTSKIGILCVSEMDLCLLPLNPTYIYWTMAKFHKSVC